MKETIKLTRDTGEMGMRKSLTENITLMLNIDKIRLEANLPKIEF